MGNFSPFLFNGGKEMYIKSKHFSNIVIANNHFNPFKN